MTFIELFKKLDVDSNAIGKRLSPEFNLAGDVSEDFLVEFIRFLLDTAMVLKTERKWNTGTPTEEGWYLLKLNHAGRTIYDTNYLWDNGFGMEWKYAYLGKIVKWQKIEENEDGKE